jgi:hypothetical protein
MMISTLSRLQASRAIREGAQVFDRLEQGEGVSRQADAHDAPALDPASVRDADRAADRDRAGRFVDEGLHGAQERIALED